MDSQPDLYSIEHIEQLILSLYQTGQPQVIASTQATLTKIHSTPRAWSIARDLLARPDEKVKFHGALILIIKLNTESSGLSDDDATELLANLLRWYLESQNRGATPLVTRKLSSALATFLAHFEHIWQHFVQNLVISLAEGQAYPPSPSPQREVFRAALERLEPVQLKSALWVIGSVAEDISKIDLNAQKSIHLYDSIRGNIEDAVLTMAQGLTVAPQTQDDAIRCLQSWVWFAQKASVRDRFFVDVLRPLVTLTIETLPNSAAVDSYLELLTEVLTNYSGLLTDMQFNMLATILTEPSARRHYQSLLETDCDFDSYQFGHLLLAYGEARVDQLIRAEGDSDVNILSILCGLLTAQGHPGVDDRIFVPALEFWATFAETLADETFSEENNPKKEQGPALSYVLQAVSNAWQKIAYPSVEEVHQWDSSERVLFHDARKDVADFLQSAYALVGPSLVFKFSDLTLEALSSSAWLQLESAAYCLGALADCVKDEQSCDDALSRVFSPSLLEALQARNTAVPARVQQTCVSLIEKYTEYFERNVAQIAPVLNLLFTLVSELGLAVTVSRSILRLCSSCRNHLHSELGAFLNEFADLSARRLMDCASSERIMGGVACVAQASPDLHTRLSACEQLVAAVENEVRHALKLASLPNVSEFPCPAGSRCLEEPDIQSPALHAGLKALRCLAAIGSGFKSPADCPVDLDAEITEAAQLPQELISLQQRIFGLVLQVQGLFPTNTEVVDSICSILRCGFSENDPGPFVFHPHDVVQYLCRHNSSTPRISAFVDIACSFVSSLQHQNVSHKEGLLSTVLTWVVGLVQQLQSPEMDPELSQSAVDFVSHLLSKSPMTLLHLEPSSTAEFFFFFTLRVLDGKEPLPKAAAAEFWSNFLNTKSGVVGVQEAASQVMETLGPVLCQSLMRNIGGNALRSELDRLSEPVKRLVTRYPAAKVWLEAALHDEQFPSSRVNSEQKKLFVKKIISLRGSRTTNQVVREFWLTARGSSFAYAS